MRRVIKPQQAEVVDSGTEKFVIFSREKRGGKGDWDFLACAWEFIPSRPSAGVTKRVEFARSSWTATLVVKRDLQIDGPANSLVMLQVDDSRMKPAFIRNLYHVDFRTWEVLALGEAPFSWVLGGNQQTLLVNREEGIVPFDVASRSMQAGAVPFELLGRDDEAHIWLVQLPHEGRDAIWTFRPSSLEYLHEMPSPLPVHIPRTRVMDTAASPDGMAWALVSIKDYKRLDDAFADKKAGTVKGTLWLAQAGQKQSRSWPVEFGADMGSGIPWIPHGMQIWFEADDLHMQAAVGDRSVEPRVINEWVVNRKDGTMQKHSAKHMRTSSVQQSRFHVPAELNPSPADRQTNEAYVLASYFLISKGRLKKKTQYPDCRVEFSPDGRQFLWKTQPAWGGRICGSGEGTAFVQGVSIL